MGVYVRSARRKSLMATKGLQITQALACSGNALLRCGVEQHASLIAILRNAVASQVEIGQQQYRLAVVFRDGFPQPLCGLTAVAGPAARSTQIALGRREFLDSSRYSTGRETVLWLRSFVRRRS